LTDRYFACRNCDIYIYIKERKREENKKIIRVFSLDDISEVNREEKVRITSKINIPNHFGISST